MSGGVDSSVAAAILKEQGYDIAGITLDLFGASANNSAVHDAKLVADSLSIPHYTVDAANLFERTVISYFLSEYKSGRTPNPCVVCNRHLKFGLLMDKATELGYDGIATGHYAIIENGMLKRGADTRKDQSYFLYPILAILASSPDKIIFPLGRMTKDEVRSFARKLGLRVAEKTDSQDICFIPSGNYLDFLKARGIGSDGCGGGGYIVDTGGKVVGTHSGIYNFTVGQRKGLGALGQRMYVKEINADSNTVVAAQEHELDSVGIAVRDIICAFDGGIDTDKHYQVQIRYRSGPVGARVVNMDAGILYLHLDTPVRAVSPGQSAVIYDGDVVVAGGVIC